MLIQAAQEAAHDTTPWWATLAIVLGAVAAALAIIAQIGKWAKNSLEKLVNQVLDKSDEHLSKAEQIRHEIGDNHHGNSPPTLRDELDKANSKLDEHLVFSRNMINRIERQAGNQGVNLDLDPDD